MLFTSEGMSSQLGVRPLMRSFLPSLILFCGVVHSVCAVAKN